MICKCKGASGFSQIEVDGRGMISDFSPFKKFAKIASINIIGQQKFGIPSVLYVLRYNLSLLDIHSIYASSPYN